MGKKVSEKQFRSHAATHEEWGTQEHGIKQALERLGFNYEEVNEGKEGVAVQSITDAVLGGFPVVLCVSRGQHWISLIGMVGKNFVTFDSIDTKTNRSENGVHVYSKKQLLRRWTKYKDKHYAIIVKK
jgi:ABC-type bacteriocin/lantibiotic exporter with double-glycine peptidase domain